MTIKGARIGERRGYRYRRPGGRRIRRNRDQRDCRRDVLHHVALAVAVLALPPGSDTITLIV